MGSTRLCPFDYEASRHNFVHNAQHFGTCMTTAVAWKDLRGMSNPTPYSPATEKMRALIVDDDRTLREGCASVLRAEGVSVEVTGRGEEAGLHGESRRRHRHRRSRRVDT